jgi:hypothetical protein
MPDESQPVVLHIVLTTEEFKQTSLWVKTLLSNFFFAFSILQPYMIIGIITGIHVS